MKESDYKPYINFEEYSLSRIKEKTRRAEWHYRTKRIIKFLKRLNKERPGLKVTAQYIADRYNESLLAEKKLPMKEKDPGFDPTYKELSANMVLRQVQDMRYEGYPVCADSTGHWYSEHPDDIFNTMKNLQKKIFGMQFTIMKLTQYIKWNDYLERLVIEEEDRKDKL